MTDENAYMYMYMKSEKKRYIFNVDLEGTRYEDEDLRM
jgi:hypothetical protein